MEKLLVQSVRILSLLVLVAPLIVATDPLPPLFFPYIVGKALYTHALIELIAGLWIILALWYPAYRPPRSVLVLILAAYLGISLLSSLFGVSSNRSLWSTYERMQGWIDLAHWTVFTIILASVFRSVASWKTILNFNLLIGSIMGLLGLAQINGIRVLDYLMPSLRVDITLGNATFVGAYMLVNIFIALALLCNSYESQNPRENRPKRNTRQKSNKLEDRADISGATKFAGTEIPKLLLWRLFWFAVVILDFVMLLRSGTRGAVIGLAFGVLAFAFVYLLWGRIRFLKHGSLGFILLVAIVLIGSIAMRDTQLFKGMTESNVMLSRLANIGPNDPNTMGRIYAARIGVNGFADRPLLGWGPENYTIAYDEHISPEVSAKSFESFDQAHNKIIEELVTKGIFGLGSYILLWSCMAWVILRKFRTDRHNEQIFTLLIGSALVSYFVQNLFLFDTPGTVGQFYLLLGLVVFIGESNSPKPILLFRKTQWIPRMWTPGSMFLKLIRTDEAKLVTFIAMAICIVTSIFFMVSGPARGSSHTFYGISGYMDGSATWNQRLDHFEQAIEAAPGLANYTRLYMIMTLDQHWFELSEEVMDRSLSIMEPEVIKALGLEPREWRFYFSSASLYQRASMRYPQYLPLARNLIEEAMELAPERIELHQLMVRQFLIEDDFDGARGVIDVYMDGHAEYMVEGETIWLIFDSLRNEIDSLEESFLPR